MKKRLALKIVLSLVVAVVIVAAAAVLVARSSAFHRFLLRQIEERAERAMGAKIEIGNYTLNWEKLHADFYDITVHGTEPPSDKPLLSVQHAGLTLKVLSLFGLKFHLASLIVNHPVLHLTVDKDGHSNLPHPPVSKKGGKPFSIFDLAVGHFAILHGEIYSNDRAIPLRAELLGLHAAVDFNAQKTEYDGDLSYRDGRIEFGSFSPLNHNLEAHFSSTPNGIRVNPLTVSALNSHATIQATLADYNQPSVKGSYTATLSMSELARWIKSSGLPSGEVRTAGEFSYRYRQEVSPLVSVSASGSLTSPRLTVRFPVIKAEATAISCKYDLRQGNLEVRDAAARIFGGVVSGKLSILHLNQRPQASMETSFRSVSLARAQAGLGRSELTKVAVRGLLDGEAEATWQDGLKFLRVQSRATIRQPEFALSANQGTSAIPLTGAMNLTYESGQLAFNETVLDAGHTEIHLSGVAGHNSSLAIQASSDDLHETVLLASTISKALSTSGHASIQPFGISGSGAFQGQLEGPIQDPKLTGQISASNLKYERITANHVQSGLTLSSSGVALHQGELAHGRALIRFNLTAGLTNWSYAPSNPIVLELSTADAPLPDLDDLLAVRAPLEGKLSAHLAMHGSQNNLAGDGSVRIVNAAVWGQPIQSIAAKLHGEGGVINATAILKSAAGDANGSITYNLKNDQYDGEITIPELRLSEL
ncbi:MAG: AsmA family protein, partial [Acidobacteriota bacterium]|nr:AsmA family protein [Acidobacteriota bacterium]